MLVVVSSVPLIVTPPIAAAAVRPACMTVTLTLLPKPVIVIVPVRDTGERLMSTEKPTVPDAFPLAPDVRVIQGTLLTAVQGQGEPVLKLEV